MKRNYMVRGMEEETWRRLGALARLAGMTLTEYLSLLIEREAEARFTSVEKEGKDDKGGGDPENLP